MDENIPTSDIAVIINKKRKLRWFWLLIIPIILFVILFINKKYLVPMVQQSSSAMTPNLLLKELPKNYPRDLPEPKDAMLLSTMGFLEQKSDIYSRRFVTNTSVQNLMEMYKKYFDENKWKIISSGSTAGDGYIHAQAENKSMSITMDTINTVNKKSSVNISFNRK